MAKLVYTEKILKSIKLAGSFMILAALILGSLAFGSTASAAGASSSKSPSLATRVAILYVVAFDPSINKLIAGATVLVVNKSGQRVAQGVTDADGFFIVNNLPADTYKVTVSAVHYRVFGQVVTLDPNRPTAVRANLVRSDSPPATMTSLK